MDRHSAFAYPAHSPPLTQRYSATSSAFSASAQPHEDWTKISDLAERRRIQNRIAQRNYRKKLKKKLEDLERRAASHSASPEQPPMQLQDEKRRRHSEQSMPSDASPPHSDYYSSTSPSVDPLASQPHHLTPIPDETAFFGQPSTRPLSASPRPFACSPYLAEPPAPFDAYPCLPHSMSTTCADMPLFANYAPAPTPTSLASAAYMDYDDPRPMYPPMKQDEPTGMPRQDLNTFAMTFVSMAGLDIAGAGTAPNAYSDSDPQTPPLMDFFEQSIVGTPPDSKHPLTPSMHPATPNLLLTDDIFNGL